MNSEFTVPDIIIGIVVASLLVLLSGIGSFSPIYNFSAGTSSGIQAESYNFFSGIRSDIEFLSGIAEVRSEKEDLEKENIALTSEIAVLQKQLKEYEVLEKQLQFDLSYNLLPARIVKYNQERIGEITINKGEKDGVKVGNIVIIDNYAVGEVINVIGDVAQVRLITSPDSKIPVISLNNDTKGVAKGDVTSGIVLEEILTEDRIKEGEIIVSSGINSNYPFGLIIGKVDEIFLVESELTKSARILTDIEFANLREIFVIIE